MNDSECYHRNRAAAVTEADVNKIQKEIQNDAESDNE